MNPGPGRDVAPVAFTELRPPAHHTSLNVLLIDGNLGDARLLQALLRVCVTDGVPDIELQWASRLSVALEHLDQGGSFDAVLLDLSLPDSCGLQTLQRLLDHAPMLPVVILACLEDERVATEAVVHGAQAYMVKGRVDGPLVVRTVRYAIERQRALAAHAHLAAIVDISDDAIIGLTLDGEITSWNHGAERLYGLTLGDVIGHSFERLADEQGTAHLRAALAALRAGAPGATSSRRMESLHTHRDGHPVPVSLHLTLVRQTSGRPLSVVCIARDLRTQREAEAARLHAAAADAARAQAESALRVRDEFMMIAAHELKTPITSLRGYSQIVQKELVAGTNLSPAVLSRALSAFTTQTSRLQHLLDQLLDVSSMWDPEGDPHRLPLHVQTVDLVAGVRRAAATMQITAPSRPIHVHVPKSLVARVDPLRLEQVLTNLIGNALKFSPTDTGVDVDLTEVEPGIARFRVRDYGSGVPDEFAERIFERHFQQAVHRRTKGGMGLGLYISRQIVDAHGGTITVERPPDGGARFVVQLPRNVRRRATSTRRGTQYPQKP